MREAAEILLENEYKSRFISIDATGENTTLADGCCDLVTSAQAFHWLDKDKAKVEFSRILKPGGYCLLIWNLRKDDALLIKYCKEYKELSAQKLMEKKPFFIFQEYEEANFPNKQIFDLISFKGRLLSSSYCPAKEEKEFEPLLDEITKLFEKYQENGNIEFIYETKVFYGKLSN